jgi:hypothetical protein
MQTKLTIECDIADAQEILYIASRVIGRRAEINKGNTDKAEYKLKCHYCATVRIQRLNTTCTGLKCGRTLRASNAIGLGNMLFRSGLTESKKEGYDAEID